MPALLFSLLLAANKFCERALATTSGALPGDDITVDETRGEAGRYYTIERRFPASAREVARDAAVAAQAPDAAREDFQRMLGTAKAQTVCAEPEQVVEHVQVEIEAAR